MRYLLDREGQVALQAISPPAQEFGSVRDVFARSYEQEKANTRSIHELYELAKNVNDYATVASLQWFLDEQVEEERVMSEALGLLEFVGDDKSAMLTLNHQFGQRQPEEQDGDKGGD
jgi:ferritin